jgi:hypothetical protein
MNGFDLPANDKLRETTEVSPGIRKGRVYPTKQVI